MLTEKGKSAWLARIGRWHEAVSRDHAWWYQRLEQARSYTADPFQQLDKIGDMVGLVRQMAEARARWPLAPEEWRDYGVAKAEIPAQHALQQVSDVEVRGALRALNRAADERDRVKAAALFCHILGSSPDNFVTSLLFSGWKGLWRAENGFAHTPEFCEELAKGGERLLATPVEKLAIGDDFAFATTLRQP